MDQIPKNKCRIIKIGKEALFEFIYESIIDNQENFFDVSDGTKIVTSFDINWETGEFICVARNELEDEEHLQFPKIDTQKLLSKLKRMSEIKGQDFNFFKIFFYMITKHMKITKTTKNSQFKTSWSSCPSCSSC